MNNCNPALENMIRVQKLREAAEKEEELKQLQFVSSVRGTHAKISGAFKVSEFETDGNAQDILTVFHDLWSQWLAVYMEASKQVFASLFPKAQQQALQEGLKDMEMALVEMAIVKTIGGAKLTGNSTGEPTCLELDGATKLDITSCFEGLHQEAYANRNSKLKEVKG